MFLKHIFIRQKSKSYCQKSFTLIELLIVIAVIGILASIILVQFPSATKKARDSRRMFELKELQKIIITYYDIYHQMPINTNPCCGYCDYQPNFLQELVDAGLYKTNPKGSHGYFCYYNYGQGNNVGVLLVTELETYAGGPTGLSGSCRPWGPGQNWCDQSNNSYYCLCYPRNPYW